MKCDNCGKGIMIGHNVSHAKNRTRKVFKPNLHSVRIWTGSSFRRMKLCTKCQRILKNRTKLSKEEVSAPEVLEAPAVVTA